MTLPFKVISLVVKAVSEAGAMIDTVGIGNWERTTKYEDEPVIWNIYAI